jgi:hypothetical protein
VDDDRIRVLRFDRPVGRRLYYGRLLVSSVRAMRPLVAMECALLILGLNSAWLSRL